MLQSPEQPLATIPEFTAGGRSEAEIVTPTRLAI